MPAVIPLAKPWTPSKMNFPCLLSIKMDGVPIRIDIGHDGTVRVNSRQGKPVPSVAPLVMRWVKSLKFNDVFKPPMTFVGELMQDDITAPFKDTSGLARQHEPTDKLNLWLFDMVLDLGIPYLERVRQMRKYLPKGMKVRPVEFLVAHSAEEAEKAMEALLKEQPGAEGMVARDLKDDFVPNKRSWGYQKLLPKPTIDLFIVGVEEAVSKDGEPKGMAGRLVAYYKGDEIGVGPGKLTHKERTRLWLTTIRNEASSQSGDTVYFPEPLMAQIEYKKDDSYEALRQPTFQCWRPDKDEPDA